MTFYIGIDGGGSHCRALLQNSSGAVLGEGRGGPANPVNGVHQAQNAILVACAGAISQANLPPSTMSSCDVGAGLAGLHLPSMQSTMACWAHPFRSLSLTTDLHVAALGAHLGRDGGVLILGTGFSALAIHKGEQLAIGGMGFPINAMGSGSWLGLEAVKAVLLAEDALGPQTAMTALLLKGSSAINLAQETVNADASVFGRYAPLVFQAAEDGDAVAEGLLRQATEFAEQVVQKIADFGAPKTVLTGSVANALKPLFRPATQAFLSEPESSPQEGAILYAKQSLQHRDFPR